ncbi:Microsomal signal peptidase subunit 3 [Wickerhamiella sorbophila]|uniref:Signal peptidase subunit 3 n=1 Tax=Wickerhamiella sorbophila TaxID=45607 RepID=A0A2T0FQ51_9ASCO|nr:Microsomal signal peptidase subunit 3 [Wickerhamiella sorbophila]PRT57105.1 Microsomal signal peptidase subunit 3 [Wickerhamiella sorbophila]
MHSFVSRVQQRSSTFSTYVIIASVVVAIVSLAQLYVSGAFGLQSEVGGIRPTLSMRTSRRFGSTGKPKENVRIVFDLDADLSPLFNWNTKQVFVYLTAEYGGAREDISNEVTFWDKIITSKADAKLALQNERSKYSIWDVKESFEGRNATVHLHWNLQPKVGFLVYGETVAHDSESSKPWFIMPREKNADKEA